MNPELVRALSICLHLLGDTVLAFPKELVCPPCKRWFLDNLVVDSVLHALE